MNAIESFALSSRIDRNIVKRIISSIAVASLLAIGAATPAQAQTPVAATPTISVHAVTNQLSSPSAASTELLLDPAEAGPSPVSTEQLYSRVVSRTDVAKSPDFAGAWIDAKQHLTIAFAGNFAKHATEVSSITLNDKRVKSVQVRYSKVELEAKQQTLMSQGTFGKGVRFTSSYIDPAANRIVLGIEGAPATPAFVRSLQARYGTDVTVTVAHVAPSETAALPGEYIDDSVWACSAAFNFNGSPPLFPDASFLTAGHCFDGFQNIYAFHDGGWPAIGQLASRHYTGCPITNPCSADVELISENLYPFTVAPSTNKLANGQAITSVKTTGLVVGESICKLGNTSGTTCGTITGLNYTFCYTNDSCFKSGILVSQDFCHGDSGGPVYYGSVAKGIVSGRTYTGSTEPPCGGAKGIASSMAGVGVYYNLATLDLS